MDERGLARIDSTLDDRGLATSINLGRRTLERSSLNNRSWERGISVDKLGGRLVGLRRLVETTLEGSTLLEGGTERSWLE